MKCAIVLLAAFALAHATPYYGAGRGGEVDVVKGGGVGISYPSGRRVVISKTVSSGPRYVDVTVEGPNVPYKRYQIDTEQYVRGQDEVLADVLDHQIMAQIDEYRRSGELDSAVAQAIAWMYAKQQQEYRPEVAYGGLQQEIYQGQPKWNVGVVPVEQEREIELQQIQQYPFNLYQRTTQYRTPLQQLQQLAYLRQAIQQQQTGPFTSTLPRQMEYLLQLQREQYALQQQIEQATLRGDNTLAYAHYQQLQQLQQQEEQIREQIQQWQQGSGLYGVWNMIRQPYGYSKYQQYYPSQLQQGQSQWYNFNQLQQVQPQWYNLNQLQQVQPQQHILGQLWQQQQPLEYVLNQYHEQPQYSWNQLQQEQVEQQRMQQKENILNELQQEQQEQIYNQQPTLNKYQQKPYGLKQFAQGLYNWGQVGKWGQQAKWYQQQPRAGVVY